MNIARHIPNTITSMNLLCGVLGVICVFNGKADTAFLLMIAAAICDFFDGFAARALKAYSDIGKELDSLADLVSFGLLPSLMLYNMMSSMSLEAGLLRYIPLLLAVASALRLAKFNTDERQSENFLGLATPASAMICGSLTYYIMKDADSFLTAWAAGKVFVPAVALILSVLMVSEIPMFSMKFKRGTQKNTPVYRMRVAFAGAIGVSA
ncbi:MAG: CDP-diacylglycerol--serine O-phosphatidyltransferase, partial [Bacteroidetes bacterium]|nr:CDP-diacylglycerol--serine O-phosphatidyltransferase [Candidatus Cryptobacteroides excrementavium]